MEFEELKKLIEEGKEQEVKDYIEGLSKPTPDGVKQYLETDEGKKVIQPILDKYHTKSLESWKQNNLEKEKEEAVEKAIAERYPEESEEQKRLKKLEKELEHERKERNREHLRNKAISQATEKGLPVDLVDHFLGEDEDSTMNNLSKFEQSMQKVIEDKVNGKFKEGGTDPHKRNKETGVLSRDDLKNMTPDEINEQWDSISKQMEEGKL